MGGGPGWRRFWDYLGLNAGVVTCALGLDLFLVPNKLVAGGVSGIATILHHVVGVPVGATMLALNVPLFIMGIYRLGFGFGFRTLYGTVALSLAVDAMAPFAPVPTREPLLACLYGGVLVGVGLGLVFRAKGTTGGTDLAAAILRTYVGIINIGQILFLVDGAVVLATGVAFRSPELAMYSLITIFVSALVIDAVQQGLGYAKAFFVISERAGSIGEAVLKELERGATALPGRGLYTGREREVLLVVVNRAEVTRLKEIVYRTDPRAFIVVADVREVLGEGFKQYTGRWWW
ncbi:MAG: YitT family protein [Firmicutes bacterium]|nr:YitT family protein [Bacillota bacterium]